MRAFVACETPDAVRDAIEEVRDSLPDEGWVRPTDRGQLHLTLKFLGDVDEGRTDELLEALRGAVSPLEPFGATVRGVGAFPRPGKPRVIWAGFEDDPRLAAIQEACEEALVDLGFEPESRDFVPHVTFARIKGGRGRGPSREDRRELAAWIEEREARELGPMPVEEVTLFESDLRPDGAVHTPRGTASLRGS